MWITAAANGRELLGRGHMLSNLADVWCFITEDSTPVLKGHFSHACTVVLVLSAKISLSVWYFVCGAQNLKKCLNSNASFHKQWLYYSGLTTDLNVCFWNCIQVLLSF